jgi:hypothetical protein
MPLIAIYRDSFSIFLERSIAKFASRIFLMLLNSRKKAEKLHYAIPASFAVVAHANFFALMKIQFFLFFIKIIAEGKLRCENSSHFLRLYEIFHFRAPLES